MQLPVGEVVEIQIPEPATRTLGSPTALLEALKRLPKLPSEDVAEMERLIEGGKSKEAR